MLNAIVCTVHIAAQKLHLTNHNNVKHGLSDTGSLDNGCRRRSCMQSTSLLISAQRWLPECMGWRVGLMFFSMEGIFTTPFQYTASHILVGIVFSSVRRIRSGAVPSRGGCPLLLVLRRHIGTSSAVCSHSLSTFLPVSPSLADCI